MKKIMGLVLGLTLVLGTTSLFAQDTAGTDTGTTKTKTKKHHAKKAKKDTNAMSSDTTGGATK